MRRDAGPEFPEPTGLSGSYFRWKFRVRLSHPPYCPSGHRIYPCGPETKNGVDTRGGGDERRGGNDRQHREERLRGSEEHTAELRSLPLLLCRLTLGKKNINHARHLHPG